MDSVAFSHFLIKADRVLDRLPFVSTASNLINIVAKIGLVILMGIVEKESIVENAYCAYLIDEKSFGRCFLLLLPGFGQLFVYLLGEDSREEEPLPLIPVTSQKGPSLPSVPQKALERLNENVEKSPKEFYRPSQSLVDLKSCLPESDPQRSNLLTERKKWMAARISFSATKLLLKGNEEEALEGEKVLREMGKGALADHLIDVKPRLEWIGKGKFESDDLYEAMAYLYGFLTIDLEMVLFHTRDLPSANTLHDDLFAIAQENLERKINIDQTLQVLNFLVLENHPYAQALLGDFLLKSAKKTDRLEGFKHSLVAAESGSYQAMENVMNAYKNGSGTSRSPENAKIWEKKLSTPLWEPSFLEEISL